MEHFGAFVDQYRPLSRIGMVAAVEFLGEKKKREKKERKKRRKWKKKKKKVKKKQVIRLEKKRANEMREKN